MQILSIGEVLWDVYDDSREFVGGAPLNVSVHARRLGNSVALVSAVGKDRRGELTLEKIRALDLATDLIQSIPGQATGTAVIEIDANGDALFTIDRPAAFDYLSLDDNALARLQDFAPEWIYYGTLAQTNSNIEQVVNNIVARFPNAKRFYDINLRSGHWNLDLVKRLTRLATTLKINDSEAELLSRMTLGNRPFRLVEFCEYWSSTYDLEFMCVTLGSQGCAIYNDGTLRTFHGFPVKAVDTVGAGDAFAAALLHGIAMNWPIDHVANFANALGALVASRPGATPHWTLPECLQLIGASQARSDAFLRTAFHRHLDSRGERE